VAPPRAHREAPGGNLPYLSFYPSRISSIQWSPGCSRYIKGLSSPSNLLKETTHSDKFLLSITLNLLYNVRNRPQPNSRVHQVGLFQGGQVWFQLWQHPELYVRIRLSNLYSTTRARYIGWTSTLILLTLLRPNPWQIQATLSKREQALRFLVSQAKTINRYIENPFYVLEKISYFNILFQWTIHKGPKDGIIIQNVGSGTYLGTASGSVKADTQVTVQEKSSATEFLLLTGDTNLSKKFVRSTSFFAVGILWQQPLKLDSLLNRTPASSCSAKRVLALTPLPAAAPRR
jgi:hypothetical protein